MIDSKENPLANFSREAAIDEAMHLWEKLSQLASAARWIVKTYDDARFCNNDMDDVERKEFEEAIRLLRVGLGDVIE